MSSFICFPLKKCGLMPSPRPSPTGRGSKAPSLCGREGKIAPDCPLSPLERVRVRASGIIRILKPVIPHAPLHGSRGNVSPRTCRSSSGRP
ncbi:hypothetical protein FCH31_18690 [Lelliottia amnigena]|nr:hypothetical protein [Lelliottia amnigena]